MALYIHILIARERESLLHRDVMQCNNKDHIWQDHLGARSSVCSVVIQIAIVR